MKQIENHIIAEEGKVFRRIADGHIFGKDIYLGYVYYINDVLLDEPHLSIPEDFEEVDDEEELTDEEALELIIGVEHEED